MTLLEAFNDLPDPRADNIRYPLTDLIFIAVCMVMCGADSWSMVSWLAHTKKDWLKKFIPLPHGVPSHDTFDRVFSLLKPKAFSHNFLKWVRHTETLSEGELIAIDGKTLRGSYEGDDKKSAIHMVNAWATNTGLVLSQLKTSEKSNEITAIPLLLDSLEIHGCIVSIDAMGCQKAIATKIQEKEADYLLAVKGNQRTLHEDIQLFLDTLAGKQALPESGGYSETLDKGHGRIDLRRGWISTDVSWLEQREEWPDLKLIGMVERESHCGNKVSRERRYFISSRIMHAHTFMRAVRDHWSIENNLHWWLDVGFNEDQSRIRKDHGPENMAILRQIALNLLKEEKSVKVGVRNRRIIAAADDKYREKLLKKAEKAQLRSKKSHMR